MRRMVLVPLMVGLAMSATAGCATAPQPDPERLAELQRVLRERPTMRPVAVGKCIEKEAAKSPAELAPIAAVMQVEAIEVPGLICPLIVDAIAAGEITPEEMLAWQLGQPDLDFVRRIASPPARGVAETVS